MPPGAFDALLVGGRVPRARRGPDGALQVLHRLRLQRHFVDDLACPLDVGAKAGDQLPFFFRRGLTGQGKHALAHLDPGLEAARGLVGVQSHAG